MLYGVQLTIFICNYFIYLLCTVVLYLVSKREWGMRKENKWKVGSLYSAMCAQTICICLYCHSLLFTRFYAFFYAFPCLVYMFIFICTILPRHVHFFFSLIQPLPWPAATSLATEPWQHEYRLRDDDDMWLAHSEGPEGWGWRQEREGPNDVNHRLGS